MDIFFERNTHKSCAAQIGDKLHSCGLYILIVYFRNIDYFTDLKAFKFKFRFMKMHLFFVIHIA